MKMMSSIIHPQVVLDLYEFLFRLLNTKEDILKNAGNKRLLILIYFHSIKKYFGSQWGLQTHAGLEQLEVE